MMTVAAQAPAGLSEMDGGDAQALLDAMPARIADLIRRHADAAPDSEALRSGDRVVSYAALWAAIERMMALLTDKGVRGGDRVMVLCETSICAVVFIFAATACDAWACPVNARMSAAEIDACRDRARARLIVYATEDSPAAKAHAEAAGAQALVDPVFGSAALGVVAVDATPEPVHADKALQPAVLLFSSGTTGTPKAIMTSHQALMYIGANMSRLRGLTAEDRFYNAAPMSHIIGLGGMLMTAIWAGAGTELVPQFRPQAFVEALAAGRISYSMGVPMIFSRVLDHARAAGVSLRSGRLRFIAVGGMPLDQALKAELEEAFGVPVGNSYAMTEMCPIARASGATEGSSVGYAQPGIAIRLAGADGAAVPIGEQGEIWAKGPNRMLGYYRDAAQTEGVMRPGGYMATGDLGVMAADGCLTITGRLKDVIIRSGFNVYPIEVEAALCGFPGVTAAAVVGRPVAGNEEVVAFVQPQPGADIDVDALAAHARAQLTAYKLPTEIRITRQLPIGPTGKIMKAELKRQLLAGDLGE